MIQHGENIALPFDSAVNEAIADGDLGLTAYGIVDWILGEESTVDHTFDPTEQAAVAAFLEMGNGLFVSGAEIGWDLVTKGNGPDFFRNYLAADMAGDDADTYQAGPTNEGIFAGLGTIDFRDAYDVDFPDQLTPRPGSIAALHYVGGLGGIAAVQHDGGGCRRVVYLGFPFETIAAAQRPAVMARVIEYLSAGGCLSSEPNTTITAPPDGAAFNTVPGFGGTASGAAPIDRVEVQIINPEGHYWDGANWTATPQWVIANGTANWSYPLPSLSQGEYNLQASAWDANAVSDTTPALASFIYDTIPPGMPALLAPAHGITASPLPDGYYWNGPQSDTGSALSYSLQVDDQTLTVPATFYTEPIWLANGEHSWRVRTHDAAGNESSWTDLWTFAVEHRDLFMPMIFKRANVTATGAESIVNQGIGD
jgi:hypothetical protein